MAHVYQWHVAKAKQALADAANDIRGCIRVGGLGTEFSRKACRDLAIIEEAWRRLEQVEGEGIDT